MRRKQVIQIFSPRFPPWTWEMEAVNWQPSSASRVRMCCHLFYAIYCLVNYWAPTGPCMGQNALMVLLWSIVCIRPCVFIVLNEAQTASLLLGCLTDTNSHCLVLFLVQTPHSFIPCNLFFRSVIILLNDWEVLWSFRFWCHVSFSTEWLEKLFKSLPREKNVKLGEKVIPLSLFPLLFAENSFTYFSLIQILLSKMRVHSEVSYEKRQQCDFRVLSVTPKVNDSTCFVWVAKMTHGQFVSINCGNESSLEAIESSEGAPWKIKCLFVFYQELDEKRYVAKFIASTETRLLTNANLAGRIGRQLLANSLGSSCASFCLMLSYFAPNRQKIK